MPTAISTPTATSDTSTIGELVDALTPAPLAAGTPRLLKRIGSPIGRIEFTSDGKSITSLSIERNGVLPHDDLEEADDPLLDRTADQLGEYFSGERRDFDVPVALVGTPFQRAVWAELQQLGWGETSSYGAIGVATGRPSAGRAVGGAIGANPVPILVGCHRVLASNRRITGYSGGNGIPTKMWLLEHESIPHA